MTPPPAPHAPRRIAVVGTSGAGKTTLGRELARRIGGTFVEVDAIAHKANWVAATDDELRAGIDAAIGQSDRWVIDGTFERRLGDFVTARVDLFVWLDLPLRTKLARALRRSLRRALGREALWNGNRETFRGVFLDEDSVLRWMVRAHFRQRREAARGMTRPDGKPTLRLRTPAEVAQWLARF
jgi:adenylate kinase family enzyme